MKWLAYNDLAWADQVIVPPEKHENEALTYIEILKEYIGGYSAKMLHLGCGAGGHDFHFENYFHVTGVDISEGMLELAENKNPEVTYIKGDMRIIRVREQFDP